MITAYDLEKTRCSLNIGISDIYTVIAESKNLEILEEKSKTVKLKSGKTFFEKLCINHLDEYGDIIHVQFIRDRGLD